MSIFKYMDYRDLLAVQIKNRRKNEPRFTQAALAERAGIRNTYLTNVLKGRANFNSDQIYALARELRLNEQETQYLSLLKEWDQCQLPDRKSSLKREIESLRQAALATEAHIRAQVRRDEHELILRYYSDPHIKIVHILLQIPRFAADYTRIGPALSLDLNQLEKIVATLRELEIVKFVNKKVEVLLKNFHLPKDSPMLLPHQTLMRTKSAQRLLELPPEQRYSLAVTFSTTEEVKEKIHQRFLEFLKEAEALVKGSESEAAYQMNFDLLPWLNLGR
ncbi:MAG: TIGR02147 family protein [Bdellovibrionales bacterium]